MTKPANLSLVLLLMLSLLAVNLFSANGRQRRIILDTDVNTDDIFGLLYLLKLNRTQFELEAITINANAWTNAGHAVNHIYDLLYMMGRDDISVGMGGEGGISDDGEIQPNVGGYLPLIEQGTTTAGSCRYRQTIPVGRGGRLDLDANYGLRRQFLVPGRRRYAPLRQPTVQQVLLDKVSAGPVTIFITGALTNVAIFLMNNPNLKNNIEEIYIMGGGVRSSNPRDCCPKNPSSCVATQCGIRGNMFSNYHNNPYAEFNMFGDPFAAYQVIHSGVPITIVPLDATNTIPLSESFFDAFETATTTYEAHYCFLTLKIIRDGWFDDQFYQSYFLWDSFFCGVAISIMSNSEKRNGVNEFAEMEYMNITVVTSNEPYGLNDGSNPFFDGRVSPKFRLLPGGVHSGHVQAGLRDPFCFVPNGKGKCMDGYTMEVTGSEGVRVLVATKAKPNPNTASKLDRAFYSNFLEVLNRPEQAGRFNFTSAFPYYKPVLYKADTGNRTLGKPVVLDMDMSAGDFLALVYLLKIPPELIDLKAVIVGATGWANGATIDTVYDILHMMGRDDIPVGLGEVFAMNQSDPTTFGVGGCKYAKAIPQGSGGLVDSDNLYGLAHLLPRSPRRYTAEDSVKFGAPRDTDHPELRQPTALDVWGSIAAKMEPGRRVAVLANGPLTNVAKIIRSLSNASSVIEEVYVVGGHLKQNNLDRGNIVGELNDFREMNMFLDPVAAKEVFESPLDMVLIPLNVQRKVTSFATVINKLRRAARRTPEAFFCRRLLSTLHQLHNTNFRYQHMGMFMGELLGAVTIGGDPSMLKTTFEIKSLAVIAEGDESRDGLTIARDKQGKGIKILKDIDPMAYYTVYANRLGDKHQSAKVGSYVEQEENWRTPPDSSTGSNSGL